MTNPFISLILQRAAQLDLPQWYLSGGCLFQTVWNVQHGFEPTTGILDYDLFYFDSSDMSREAEDAAATEVTRIFEDIPVTVELRNQARVYMWYEDEFGAPCRAFTRCEDGIDSFLATSCCYGLRQENGNLRIYAPHGFSDLFTMIVRPNPVRAIDSPGLREVYNAKVQRWLQQWPRITVLPWPVGGFGST